MRKSRIAEVNIIGMMKEKEAGMLIEEGCCRHGLRLAYFSYLRLVLQNNQSLRG